MHGYVVPFLAILRCLCFPFCILHVLCLDPRKQSIYHSEWKRLEKWFPTLRLNSDSLKLTGSNVVMHHILGYSLHPGNVWPTLAWCRPTAIQGHNHCHLFLTKRIRPTPVLTKSPFSTCKKTSKTNNSVDHGFLLAYVIRDWFDMNLAAIISLIFPSPRGSILQSRHVGVERLNNSRTRRSRSYCSREICLFHHPRNSDAFLFMLQLWCLIHLT